MTRNYSCWQNLIMHDLRVTWSWACLNFCRVMARKLGDVRFNFCFRPQTPKYCPVIIRNKRKFFGKVRIWQNYTLLSSDVYVDLSDLTITLSRHDVRKLQKNSCKPDLLDTQKSWLDCEHVVITINQPSHLKNAFFYDVDVNRESLGCPEDFGTKFEIFRAKKSMLNFLFCVMNWLWISYAKASWWPQAADCLKGRPRKKICRYIWLVEKRILPLLYRSHLLWTELWGIFLAPTKKNLFSKALVTKLFVSPRGDSTAVIVHE